MGSDYEYGRKTYRVPAYAGVRVNANWSEKKTMGTIVRGHDDNYVHVKFDGRKSTVPVHPLDLEYHP